MLIQSTCIAGDSSSIRTSDPFVLAVEIKSIFKAKDFKSIEILLSDEAKITESEFRKFYEDNASFGDKKSPTLAKLITDSDYEYIEGGMRRDEIVSGVIYFITTPEIQKRREWLRDYAACAFTTIDGNLMLRNGFCFIGTDGAPELDPVEVQLHPKEQGEKT